MSLDEIEKCFRILMNHVRYSGVTELNLKGNDFYWTITSPEWLTFDVEPTPAVGSLDDDQNELGRLLDNPSRATAVDIDRLAHLMMYLSDELSGLAPDI